MSRKSINCNQIILESLLGAKEALSEEAQNHILSFLRSQKCESGGFIDKAGKSDLYYSVFGYTLALVLDLKLDITREKEYLKQFDQKNLDFVHSVCLVRAFYLLHLIDLKQKTGFKATKYLRIGFAKDLIVGKLAKKTMNDCSAVLWELETYISKDDGYNHNAKEEEQSTVYANYLMWTLYQDLQIEEDSIEEIQNANQSLILDNGSYANESNSSDGVTSATAAGMIMNSNHGKSKEWLLEKRSKRAGFIAATGVPVSDLLSTATALLALKMSGENMDSFAENSLNFINLHWDESGGFFGSIADMSCDVEYTYYALLGLGVLS
ncbi:prenyltransferase/squalene oxidase repeat-containing protein [Marinifilum breve]|uniref:prenyltransferase/squalene oxidase repeat-containing protein n=1 Tax=Marinifilum breve TaxID=2184082 RepID=UPI0014040881|nr:prenyltransferase/squalene oxidase repeat-containing protein [Marinifilum breve]